MTLTEEQFSILMQSYLGGTASRTERQQLMVALAASDDLCHTFNAILALERVTAEAADDELLTDKPRTGSEPFTDSEPITDSELLTDSEPRTGSAPHSHTELHPQN